MSKLNIVVVDDNIKDTDPLLVELKRHFGENANIILKNQSQEGLEYVLNNLSSKMIVLLDYDFGSGELNGTEVFKKIREETSLLHIIIITAKLLDDISKQDLVEYINKNVISFIDKTASTKDKLNKIQNVAHSLDVRIDCVLEQWITNHPEADQNKPYLTTANKQYTLKDILGEIRMQTELGKKMERNIMMLAVDLITRDKKTINND